MNVLFRCLLNNVNIAVKNILTEVGSPQTDGLLYFGQYWLRKVKNKEDQRPQSVLCGNKSECQT